MRRKLFTVIFMLAFFAVAGIYVCYSQNEVQCFSDFERVLHENGIQAVFSDMQKGRSELFPVKGYETEHGWKIAVIENEEVFYQTLENEDDAEKTYLLSCGKENMTELFYVGADIIYYRGGNEEVRAALKRMHNRQSVLFASGIYDYDDWDDPLGTYKGDAIPDADTAARIARAILSGMNTGENMYVLSAVTYDEKDGIWIVDFSAESENPDGIMIGGGYSIAMKKKDGGVLRIWTGE